MTPPEFTFGWSLIDGIIVSLMKHLSRESLQGFRIGDDFNKRMSIFQCKDSNIVLYSKFFHKKLLVLQTSGCKISMFPFFLCGCPWVQDWGLAASENNPREAVVWCVRLAGIVFFEGTNFVLSNLLFEFLCWFMLGYASMLA